MKHFILMIACILGVSFHAYANDVVEKENFGDIPILFEGRVQPIDSFSRTVLKTLSGQETLEGLSAQAWLIETIFDPARAVERPLFNIDAPLHTHARFDGENPLISYLDLMALLDTEPSLHQVFETYGVDGKILIYEQLLRSMSMFLPIQIDGTDSGTDNGIGTDFLTLQSSDPANSALLPIVQGGQQSQILKVIKHPEHGYVAPWQIITHGLGTPATTEQFLAWKGLTRAYISKDKSQWISHINTLANPHWQFSIERIYNGLQPVTLLIGVFTCCFIILLLGDILSKPALIRLGFAVGWAGVALQVLEIIARILILSRPPIGTLYESTLFVAAVLAISGLLLGVRHYILAIVACMLVMMILLVSHYIKPEGDQFALLDAVLNTNFWLATHVIFITIGYGWCLLISLLAQIQLFAKTTIITASHMRKMITIALIFTVIGTLLGGLWADQSWGRFWGWDPKENGALLIVLWLVWFVHARISGHVNHTYYLAGMAFLSVIVALSWFGVNLLSVGLHSYGFIEGIALGLFAFCGAQTLIIVGLLYRQNLLKRGS